MYILRNNLLSYLDACFRGDQPRKTTRKHELANCLALELGQNNITAALLEIDRATEAVENLSGLAYDQWRDNLDQTKPSDA